MKNFIASFYKFVQLADLESKSEELLKLGQEGELKGTIILAPEGINGTICGAESGVKAIIDWLRLDSSLADINPKYYQSETVLFERFKVKLKPEIVTLGKPEVNPEEIAGIQVTAQEWNKLLQDPEVIVIDTRNNYEVEVGSFKGAKNPQTRFFREFPHYVKQQLDPEKHTKIAMFCTGGIRCEKASTLLLQQGFKEVYQLKGGILSYLGEIEPQESLWEGECFVFDQRVSLGEKLTPGSYDICNGCGHPLPSEDTSCPQCFKARVKPSEMGTKLKSIRES